nr:hypothetical protein [uncultured Prevotella sp.]
MYEIINKGLIEQILIQSLKRLYEIDEPNIKYEVSERNVCARLAHHMENVMREYDQQNNSYYFQNYYVDVEYNRMGFGDLKHFEDYKHVSHYMVSDLLIHSRGYERNLLAVEMKKPRNRKTVEEDKKRLRSLVTPPSDESPLDCVHGTMLGAFIVYSIKGVEMELFYYSDEDGEVKTEQLRAVWDVHQYKLRFE